MIGYILAFSYFAVMALMAGSMAVGGIRSGKVYYLLGRPPICFCEHPFRFVGWVAVLVVISAFSLAAMVFSGWKAVRS